MTSLNNYYSEIRSDIAKDFGLSSAGYAPTSKSMPVRIAQRITNAYPRDFSLGRFNSTLNPQAVRIAKRYMSRVMGVK